MSDDFLGLSIMWKKDIQKKISSIAYFIYFSNEIQIKKMNHKTTKLIKTLACFGVIIVLSACSGNRKQAEFAGGSFHLAVDNEPSDLSARNVADYYSFSILSHVMEGLVSVNIDDLTLQPQLAKSWKANDEGSIFTFVLRDDVLFHNHEAFSSDDDRKMTMDDVLYSFEKSCSPQADGSPSEAFLTLFASQVKGADDFYSGKAKSISGVHVGKDKHELVIELITPDQSYVNKLANVTASIVSKKVESFKGAEFDVVGTGPFCFTKETTHVAGQYALTKNPDYYMVDEKGCALPYLDSVIVHIEPKKLEQLDWFEQGKLDMISGLPTSRITSMLEDHIKDFNTQPPLYVLYNNPLLTTEYYFFNMTEKRFQDVRVRQAFNYAIDRKRLADNVLRNQYYEYGIYGITPPIGSVFKGFGFADVKKASYDFDPVNARKLLADAGYPGGKGFGSVNLRFDIKDLNSAVAEEVANQLNEVLGINVNLDGSTFEQRNQDEVMANGDVFRTAWIADYVSPETFLMNFYGKLVPNELSMPSSINHSRYKNAKFDEYFELARKSDRKKRYEYFTKAEVELMKNPPIIPLWYANNFTITYSKVRNLKNNALQIIDLRKVYKKEWTKEEFIKATKK